MDPQVSVVLPVFNGARYLPAAIESVLDQTFRDFEFVIIDDGSTDSSPEIIDRCQDERIRWYSQPNHGLAYTLNRGIGLARGVYIARQDQDDISFPNRLARQVEFLESNPACGLVGTWSQIWADDAPTDRMHAHPAENAALQFRLLLDNPFVHSSVMLRASCLDEVGLYSIDPSRQPPEDFELWSRVARRFDVANLPDVLHAYREVPTSMSRTGPSPFLEHLVTISAENVGLAAGVGPHDPDAINIAAISHGAYHRVIGSPDFSSMSTMFSSAARQVAGDSPVVQSAAHAHVQILRRTWLERRRHPLERHARRVARRVFGRYRSLAPRRKHG
jgi:hypothetical protein